MRPAIAMLAGTLTVIAGAAYGQNKPVLAPTRDVTVTYRVSGANRTNGAAVIKMTYADHDRKVRLDLFAFEGATTPFDSLIYDQPANHVLSLFRDRNIYYEVPATGRANPGLMLGGNMQYKKLGTEKIAGHTCSDWQVLQGTEPKGTACVTDDGVVLRGTRLQPPGGLTAIVVDYATLPPGVFQPDPGMVLQSNRSALPTLPARPRR